MQLPPCRPFLIHVHLDLARWPRLAEETGREFSGRQGHKRRPGCTVCAFGRKYGSRRGMRTLTAEAGADDGGVDQADDKSRAGSGRDVISVLLHHARQEGKALGRGGDLDSPGGGTSRRHRR